MAFLCYLIQKAIVVDLDCKMLFRFIDLPIVDIHFKKGKSTRQENHIEPHTDDDTGNGMGIEKNVV